MRILLALGVALFALAGGGCGDEPRTCYPGDYRRCSCDDDKIGFERCEPAGDAYGACDCSGVTPGQTGDGSTSPGYTY